MTHLELVQKLFGSKFSISRWFSGTGTDASGHNGIDLAAKEGTPIYAVAAGRVEYARDARLDSNCGAAWACGGGNVINVNIGGDKATQYAHLSRIVVARGAEVQKGQLIGYVGRTGGVDSKGNSLIPGAEFVGAHLHFGLWDKKKHLMVNPTSFLESVGGVTPVKTPTTPASSASLLSQFLATIGKNPSDPISQDDIPKFVQFMQSKGLVPPGSPNSNPLVNSFQNAVKSHVGQPWSSLGDSLLKDAATPNDPFGIVGAVGTVTDTVIKVATYALAVVLLVVGLYIYGRSSDQGVPLNA